MDKMRNIVARARERKRERKKMYLYKAQYGTKCVRRVKSGKLCVLNKTTRFRVVTMKATGAKQSNGCSLALLMAMLVLAVVAEYLLDKAVKV